MIFLWFFSKNHKLRQILHTGTFKPFLAKPSTTVTVKHVCIQSRACVFLWINLNHRWPPPCMPLRSVCLTPWLCSSEGGSWDPGDPAVPLHGLARPRRALSCHRPAGLHQESKVQDPGQRGAHGGPLQVSLSRSLCVTHFPFPSPHCLLVLSSGRCSGWCRIHCRLKFRLISWNIDFVWKRSGGVGWYEFSPASAYITLGFIVHF